MVYLPPPQYASETRPSYAEAYANILATHRRSPATSASSVILLVAPDVDSLCAARMLEDLLKGDDVMHRIIPVSGHADLETKRDELATYADVGSRSNSIKREPCSKIVTASYTDSNQHGCHSRPSLARMVWRLQPTVNCSCNRLFATSELVIFIRQWREW